MPLLLVLQILQQVKHIKDVCFSTKFYKITFVCVTPYFVTANINWSAYKPVFSIYFPDTMYLLSYHHFISSTQVLAKECYQMFSSIFTYIFYRYCYIYLFHLIPWIGVNQRILPDAKPAGEENLWIGDSKFREGDQATNVWETGTGARWCRHAGSRRWLVDGEMRLAH